MVRGGGVMVEGDGTSGGGRDFRGDFRWKSEVGEVFIEGGGASVERGRGFRREWVGLPGR